MPIALIVQLIAQVGYPLAMELLKLWEVNPAATLTSSDLLALHAKWGEKSAADYLAEAQTQASKPTA